MASSSPRGSASKLFDRVLTHFTFQGRVRGEIGFLITLVVVCSLLGAILSQAGGAGFAAVLLWPGAVLAGQVWRLVTWSVLALSPWDILFTGIALYYFGSDLAYVFGARRFFGLYFAAGAIVGALTCALALAWSPLGEALYGGASPLVSAIAVAWGTLNPDREMYLFVFRVPGRAMVALSVAILVVVAAFDGIVTIVPHALAIAIALLFVNRRRLDVWTGRAKKPKRPSHLRAVRDDTRWN